MLSGVHCITGGLLSETFAHRADQEQGTAIPGHGPSFPAHSAFHGGHGLFIVTLQVRYASSPRPAPGLMPAGRGFDRGQEDPQGPYWIPAQYMLE